jgi:hypothetical protein
MSRDAKWIWNAETPASVRKGDEVVADQRGGCGEAVAG